ncbi:4-hydroxybenzoate octaprenyltransferase [Saezia sanguinis]|uniref:4-hydroxybenzoate octaprenyltransferase n=2 Tax=Saezia sanguinis TaxID=1965230 RepID=A0A433SEZ7_9BURK|nr:4-hydroxybenzoate octaprenyltransferase [Saezia sanguinis]
MNVRAYMNLVRWDRPAGWLLLLWPTLSALWLAAGGFPGWHLIIVFTLGTILMRFAGCCINDVADRKFDLYVKRTIHRPVTSGELSVKQALMCGAILALLSFALVLTTNLATIVASLLGLFVTLIYPYTKRFFSIPQAVLGIAFSFGIPMAFTAVLGTNWTWHGVITGTQMGYAWLLLLGNLFWVIAYDTEYAMVDRDDDLKLGMIKTSAITFGKYDTFIIMLCYVAFLFIWSQVGFRLGARWPYWLGLLVAFAQAIWHYTLIENRTREGCFKAFTKNHWIGFSIFAGVLAGSLLPY